MMPRIAVNCDFDPGKPGAKMRRKVTLYEPYVRAIEEAGGLPILVPPSEPEVLKEYLDLADGILFTGGGDYPPEIYGQKRHPKVVETQAEERAKSDQMLMKLTLGSTKPAFGICAGLQLLNISSKGALIQHLLSAKTHVAHGPELDARHSVEVLPETQLAGIFGAGEIEVNSAHHQAADPGAVGAGLKISARAADGTIEGLELERSADRFFVFVQWHPERMRNEAHRRRIFSAFIDACRNRGGNRPSNSGKKRGKR